MMTFDYIIIGAGAAGSLLADGLGKDPFFQDKSILLLDKSLKQDNDRTWCFWETGTGDFDLILRQSWDQVTFSDSDFSKTSPIHPYKYKMLQAGDFYRYYKDQRTKYPNITSLTTAVTGVADQGNGVLVQTELGTYRGTKVFNSILDPQVLRNQTKFPVLQQHFIGWFVKTSEPRFKASTVHFMDFSVPQRGNTRFMYVLPLSTTEALIEYTLFSKNTLPTSEYEIEIADYLQNNLGCTEYTILSRENGNIPMTCYNFNLHNSKNLLHIGLAGGWAKPSSGYTFMRTHKKTKALLDFLKKDLPLDQFYKKTRFWFYDLLLLDILNRENHKGAYIFGQLFRKCPPQVVFRFLDEESTLYEDFKIISACPKKEFIWALIRRFSVF